VERRLLSAGDPVTGTEITLAPPPHMTPFLEQANRRLSFPPRFGEQNGEVYGELGYSEEALKGLQEKGII
ncbi:MAG: CoA transferase, partial [Deltaproteobacteria bacterium]|nr:CoA transferase [Deltaproteobacteria bacterium]